MERVLVDTIIIVMITISSSNSIALVVSSLTTKKQQLCVNSVLAHLFGGSCLSMLTLDGKQKNSTYLEIKALPTAVRPSGLTHAMRYVLQQITVIMYWSMSCPSVRLPVCLSLSATVLLNCTNESQVC